MERSAGKTEFTNLSTEQVSEQNQEAYDYLEGLLGEETGKVVYPGQTAIELTQETDTNLLQIRFVTLPGNIAEDPHTVAHLVDERYWISREYGLEEVNFQGHAYLKTTLRYLININHGISGTKFQGRYPDTLEELDLLPAGKESAKTGAKLIADTVKDYIDSQPE